MWSCSKKLACVSTVICLVVQFRVLSWAVSVHTKEAFKMEIDTAQQGKELPPTLYEHYTLGGVTSGLVPTSNGFLLNGKPFRIFSGAVHYFRVHPAYWRDRLRKLRAAGITAVETYVAWNLHEPQKNVFDFGKGNNDMSIFLDLKLFIQTAYEEDLFVILRPGPYICSEWDFGGLPSWLLRDPTMHVRTSYGPYVDRVDKYLEKLSNLVNHMQFTSSYGKGPIIAFQVENEYGSFGYQDHPRDKAYLQHLSDKMKSLGLKELFFTSDSPAGYLDWGSIPGVLQTANFQSGATQEFKMLQELQPNMPLMVTEFWSGWFDHWTQDFRKGLKLKDFETSLMEILSFDASVSFYMFHGGTNFGFMNGANVRKEYPGGYLPDITSYDYDAPLSEAGDYTDKYEAIVRLINSALAVRTRLPQRPAEMPKKAYDSIAIDSYLSFTDMLDQMPQDLITSSDKTLSMEELPVNNLNGQSYGFVVYRNHVVVKNASTLLVRGHIRDFAQVLVNGQLQTPPVKSLNDLEAFGSWCPRDAMFQFGSWRPLDEDPHPSVIDIVVENMGRVNFGEPHDFIQKKGLWEGHVSLDSIRLSDWKMIPLEFKGDWVRNLKNWNPFSKRSAGQPGPLLVRASLIVAGPISDTFIDMSSWGKGVVFVNGFNLGRYWSYMGPQKTLYLPAPLLKRGENTIVIYEQFSPSTKVKFTDKPILGEPRAESVS